MEKCDTNMNLIKENLFCIRSFPFHRVCKENKIWNVYIENNIVV